MKLIWMLVVLILLAACAPQSEPQISVTPVAAAAENTPEASPEVESSPGLILFTEMKSEAGFACATCHHYQSTERLIGPSLVNMTVRFESYDLDTTLEDYIRESILDPRIFIAPGDPPFPAEIMPRNYSEIFSEDELEAIIQFLMSL